MNISKYTFEFSILTTNYNTVQNIQNETKYGQKSINFNLNIPKSFLLII